MILKTDNGNIVLEAVSCFNVALCLDCGQAFRWSQNKNGEWEGVASGKYLKIKQEGDTVTLFNTTEEDFYSLWNTYFDLERDYNAIISAYTDKSLKTACKEYEGIRILKQDEWEAICSFIISANNNIPRIKGIIERFCREFGEKAGDGYSFPTPQRIASLTVEDLSPIRAGFRAKYIIDAAQKIASGQVDIARIKKLPFDEAKAELLKIKGVGEKVAQCALLYGFGRIEAFPVDVWVKRIVAELYPDGLPECIKGTEGIAQQYLFHWRRNI
ncbi:MAG: DNA-3-methyladenine glycosylase 2 family protein [Clostridia bacterium]|nr:DNA-3-methyladenine glycosylase 2 family protein [Clostridia bacterium]